MEGDGGFVRRDFLVMGFDDFWWVWVVRRLVLEGDGYAFRNAFKGGVDIESFPEPKPCFSVWSHCFVDKAVGCQNLSVAFMRFNRFQGV